MAAKLVDYYRIVQPTAATATVTDNQLLSPGYASSTNYNWYHKIIQGSASRQARYNEYNAMDNDVEIARALDTIAEAMVPKNNKTGMAIDIEMVTDEGQDLDDSLVITLKAAVRHWSELHGFEANRLFKLVRNMIKYGDCFFKKSSNFKKWEWIPSSHIMGAVVHVDDVTKVVAYQIKSNTKSTSAANYSNSTYRLIDNDKDFDLIPADQMVVFSINDDMSDEAPFGESVLRTVYKTHKQKELIEDAMIIYRIQRAPEKRVWYIDVGKMHPSRVKTYLETVKNESKQKSVPSHGMNGKNTVDAVYNPACLVLDTMIPLLDGRTLSLSDIIEEHNDGKELWGYSVNPETGAFAPGLISWAGVTRKDTQVIKLTFDNGKTLTCTPDHKIPVQGKGFVEAKDLSLDDSLFPFNMDDVVTGVVDGNHKITSIEYLTETMDTGTLTIDQNEIHHNYHTFAIDAGIYVKNSMLEDIFIAQRCISLDTRIHVVNIGILSLHQVIVNHSQGIKQQVLTVNQDNGLIEAKYINWAGITKLDEPVITFTLENGKTLTCTPDHKLINSDLQEIEAHNLSVGDSLIGKNQSISIIKIEDIGEILNVGCLTVDTTDNNHNFYLESGIFIRNSDGVGSKVETLNSGQSLGELSDLEYLADKVLRGLRVPIAWMKPGANNAVFNDGKLGSAYVEERQFDKYCERLQVYVDSVLDAEFKSFMFSCNINIDHTVFNIKLPRASNYLKYQQAEMDNTLLGMISSADSLPYLSKRFILKNYLQLDETSILENEQLLVQEKGMDKNKDKTLQQLYGAVGEADMGMGMGGGLGGMDMGGLGGPGEIGGPGDDTISIGGAPGGELPPIGGAPETPPPAPPPPAPPAV